jgi:hypothetical protein
MGTVAILRRPGDRDGGRHAHMPDYGTDRVRDVGVLGITAVVSSWRATSG